MGRIPTPRLIVRVIWDIYVKHSTVPGFSFSWRNDGLKTILLLSLEGKRRRQRTVAGWWVIASWGRWRRWLGAGHRVGPRVGNLHTWSMHLVGQRGPDEILPVFRFSEGRGSSSGNYYLASNSSQEGQNQRHGKGRNLEKMWSHSGSWKGEGQPSWA